VDDDAAIRVTIVRHPKMKQAEDSVFLKRWRSIKEFLVSLVCYAIGFGIIVGSLVLWRTYVAKPVLVILPFSVPTSAQSPVGLSGISAANLLLDKVEELSREASQYGRGVKTFPLLTTERNEEPPEVKVEIAGLSVDGIIGLFSKIVQKQLVVTGEVYWVTDGILLRARLENDVWTTGPFTATGTELEKRYRVLAKDILSSTNPNIAGLIFQKDGELDLAQMCYKKWLELPHLNNDSVAQAHFQLGVTFDIAGNRPSAEQSYLSALAARGDLFEALVNLGIDLYADGSQRDALVRLQRAHSVRPNSLMPLMIMGVAETDPKKKEQIYREAIGLHPEMPELHHELGSALVQLNRNDEAKTEFKREQTLRASEGPGTNAVNPDSPRQKPN
jgi:tetratricopeptide (TPR) repeat protein